MGQFVFAAHSGFRYIVLLLGLVTLIMTVLALSGGAGSAAARRAVRFFRFFTTSLDIQLLLGVLTAVLRPFVPQYIGHIVMMVLAVIVAHGIAVRLKKAPDGGSPTVVLAGVLIPLLLIVGAILAIGRAIV